MPEENQLVLLISPRGKRYLRTLDPTDALHTGDGVLAMQDVAAAQFGQMVLTHTGQPYRLMRPTLFDLAMGVRRQTQIIYPKEMGTILVRLGIGPGTRVIEAGSGSGSLTLALSHAVGETGRVYTHERRPEFSALAAKNLKRAGLGGNVEFIERDIAEGFAVSGVDALFLDVRTPWAYLGHVAEAVAPGAPVGFILPTVNQVDELVAALEDGPFGHIEVLETLERRWKAVPGRMRPEDRMIGHTGFLVFARQMEPYDGPVQPLGTRERKQEKARQQRRADAESGGEEQE